MATETTDPVRLPPGPRWPKLIQGAVVLALRYQSIAALGRKFGPSFTLSLPAWDMRSSSATRYWSRISSAPAGN